VNKQRISPYKIYTIYVDTRSLVITTSLKDGQTVETAFLTFTASAAFGDDDVDVLVECAGVELVQIDGVYEVALEEGENQISIFSEYDEKHKAREEYTIYYVPPPGMHIETDLQDQTIRAVTGEFSFQARVIGGSDRTEFTVSLNNRVITGENDVYEVELEPQGTRAYNTIRLKAKDSNEEDSKTFKIKYIPEATEETAPKITHINISDGQTIKKKNPFVLQLAAEDYQGKKIYFDGMEVYLNGSHQILRETTPYVTYKLNFVEGANELRVSITDDDGRNKEFVYTIQYVQPDENQKVGTVTVSMDANVIGLGMLIEPTTVDLYAGDNMAKVIVRVLEARGFGCNYTGSLDRGFYLASISRSGIGSSYNIPEALQDEITETGISWQGDDLSNLNREANSLGQRDYTTASGWMIIANGSFLSEGASETDINDGDIIKVRYTLANGMDIGGVYMGNTFVNTY